MFPPVYAVFLPRTPFLALRRLLLRTFLSTSYAPPSYSPRTTNYLRYFEAGRAEPIVKTATLIAGRYSQCRLANRPARVTSRLAQNRRKIKEERRQTAIVVVRNRVSGQVQSP